MAQVRRVSIDSLNGFRHTLLNFLENNDGFDPTAWAVRQIYIALGNFVISSALLGVDTCPMEGIEPAKYDAILELADSGFRTVVACAAGFRAPHDTYATLPKVRFEADELIKHVE